MKGTEKQVKWAEDIKVRYEKTVETLKEIVAIYSDTTQKDIVDHDPIFGDSTQTVYVRKVNMTNHQAAIASASHWKPEKEAGKEYSWIENRSKDIGGEHAERLARRDFYAATLGNLEKALAEEDSASYWIDRR
jgi:hypothetical protein